MGHTFRTQTQLLKTNWKLYKKSRCSWRTVELSKWTKLRLKEEYSNNSCVDYLQVSLWRVHQQQRKVFHSCHKHWDLFSYQWELHPYWSSQTDPFHQFQPVSPWVLGVYLGLHRSPMQASRSCCLWDFSLTNELVAIPQLGQVQSFEFFSERWTSISLFHYLILCIQRIQNKVDIDKRKIAQK